MIENERLRQAASAAPELLHSGNQPATSDDQLAQQQALLEGIVDSLPVGLHVVDRAYNIVAWNRNREDGIYGIKRGDAIGKSLFDVLRKQPRTKLEQEFDRVFAKGELERMEATTTISGERRHFLISKIPMSLDGTTPSHVITMAEDITERKRMLEQAAASEKLAAIGQLAAGVVHEINNPLATIAVCAEALLGRLSAITVLPAELHNDFKEYLTIIESEAFRCKKITNSLLEFSHAQTSTKEQLELNLLLDQTLFLLKHSKQLKGIELNCSLADDLEPVWGNDGQLKQAFMALILNAADAMTEGGQLSIRTEWQNETRTHVAMEFHDTGCGIAPEHLPKIFDPFFTTKARGVGTGLGLSICYGIITEHGGEIRPSSELGRGTTFRVTLPVARLAGMEGSAS